MKYTIIEVGVSVGAFVLLYVRTCDSIYNVFAVCFFFSGSTMDFTFSTLCLDCNCGARSHFEMSNCSKGLSCIRDVTKRCIRHLINQCIRHLINQCMQFYHYYY